MSRPSPSDAGKLNLNPVLQSALASLDVTLEDELDRYRQLKSRNQAKFTPVNEFTPITAPSQPRESVHNHKADDEPIKTEFQQQQEPMEDVFASVVTPQEESPQVTSIVPQPRTNSVDDLEERTAYRTKEGRLSKLLTPLGAGAALLVLTTFGLVLSWLIAPSGNSNRLKLAWQNLFPTQESTIGKVENNNRESQIDASKSQELEITPDLSKPTPDSLNLEELPRLEGNSPPSPDPVVPEVSNPETSQSEPANPPRSNSNLSRALLPSLAPPPSSQNPAGSSPNSQNSSELPSAASVTPTEGVIVPKTSSEEEEVASESKGSGYYYVVVPYLNSSSLSLAQTVVPDAYVEKFDIGMRIQMGAFNSESDAQSLINRLKQEGIDASIYRP